MNSKLLLLLAALLLSSSLFAQDLGVAINISHGEKMLAKRFYHKLLEEVKALKNDKYVVYEWDRNAHKLNLNKEISPEEKPVELAVFVQQSIPQLSPEQLKLEFKTDTSGYITKAHFKVPFEAIYTIKVVNVKTAKVEEAAYQVKTQPIVDKFENVNYYVPVDVKKYIGRKNLKILQSWDNRKEYNALIARIKKAYQKKLRAKYDYLASLHLKDLPFIAKTINKYDDNQVYTVEVPDIKAKKIKLLTINGGSKDGIKNRDNFHLYSTIEINGKKYPIYIADIFADKVEEQSTVGKKYGLSISAKNLANKLRENAAAGFFAAKNRIAINKIVSYPPEEKLNIALATDCMMCNYSLEEGMVRSVEINLIERAAPELDQLRALYKDERFIDYNLGNMQDQQIGAKYLLSFAGSNLNITDIATGKLISMDKATGRKNWLIPGFTNAQAWKIALLGNSDKAITYQRTIKEKKGKVKSIEIFHPFEVGQGDKYDISVLQTEEIAGQKVERKVLIATGYAVPSSLTPHLGVMKINDGRKKLFKALESGQKLVFTYSIKRK